MFRLFTYTQTDKQFYRILLELITRIDAHSFTLSYVFLFLYIV